MAFDLPLDVDMLPAVVGATIYFLYKLLEYRRSRQEAAAANSSQKTSALEPQLSALDGPGGGLTDVASESETEPAEEPSPEPQPEANAPRDDLPKMERAAPKSHERKLDCGLVKGAGPPPRKQEDAAGKGHFAAAPFGLALFVWIIAANSFSGRFPGDLLGMPQAAAPAAANLSAGRTMMRTAAAPANASATSDKHEEPEATEILIIPAQEPANETMLVAPMPEELLAVPPVVGASSAAAAAEAGAGGGVPELQPLQPDPSSGRITLALTRQQMTIQEVGDVMYHKSAYWGVITVGTPAVAFKVVFDTGSGHLVLPSTYCHSETCRVHKRYRRSGSSTAKDIDYDGTPVQPGQPRDQITVSFGTGEITGVFVEDVLCLKVPDDGEWRSLDGLKPGCMRLRITAATSMSEDPFKSFQFDGVLGLGLPALSQTPEFNFNNVIAQVLKSVGSSQPYTFAVFLAEHEEEESDITFGGFSEKHLASDLVWTPVYEPDLGHWLVEIKALYVNEERISFCDDGTCRAVVDTGTSLLSVPTTSFPELFESLRHSVNPDGECNGPGPQLHFQMAGEFTVTMQPQDYARSTQTPPSSTPRWPKQRNETKSSNEKDPYPDTYCKPMLMAMDLPEPIGPKLFILGEPVLRRYYTVYDSEGMRVGFGKAKHVVPHKVVDEDNDDWWYEE